MASHSFNLQLARPRDHFVSGGRQVFIGCGLSQDGRADEQVYRVRKWQGRLLRVSLVAQLDAKSGSQKAGVPVAADGVERCFTSEVGGALQPVRGTSRDVAHGSLLSEGIEDGDAQPLSLRPAVGDRPQNPQRLQDCGKQVGRVVLRLHLRFLADRPHSVGSNSFVRCANYGLGGEQ